MGDRLGIQIISIIFRVDLHAFLGRNHLGADHRQSAMGKGDRASAIGRCSMVTFFVDCVVVLRCVYSFPLHLTTTTTTLHTPHHNLLDFFNWEGGFDGIGNVAGEIKGGRWSFFAVMIFLMPVLVSKSPACLLPHCAIHHISPHRNTYLLQMLICQMLNYVTPVVIGFAIVPDRSQWKTGFITTVSK